jgi:hypothetical protein
MQALPNVEALVAMPHVEYVGLVEACEMVELTKIQTMICRNLHLDSVLENLPRLQAPMDARVQALSPLRSPDDDAVVDPEVVQQEPEFAQEDQEGAKFVETPPFAVDQVELVTQHALMEDIGAAAASLSPQMQRALGLIVDEKAGDEQDEKAEDPPSTIDECAAALVAKLKTAVRRGAQQEGGEDGKFSVYLPEDMASAIEYSSGELMKSLKFYGKLNSHQSATLMYLLIYIMLFTLSKHDEAVLWNAEMLTGHWGLVFAVQAGMTLRCRLSQIVKSSSLRQKKWYKNVETLVGVSALHLNLCCKYKVSQHVLKTRLARMVEDMRELISTRVENLAAAVGAELSDHAGQLQENAVNWQNQQEFNKYTQDRLSIMESLLRGMVHDGKWPTPARVRSSPYSQPY